MKTTKIISNKGIRAALSIVMISISSIGFAQGNTYTDSGSHFDTIMLFCILCISVLAAAMFIAMYKSKSKESKDRRLYHEHRKQARVDQYRYMRKWEDA